MNQNILGQRSSKRRKLGPDRDIVDSVHISEKMSIFQSEPHGILDNDHWQGWAEIESDPAFFNVMLRELGVRGVAVREIFSLEADMLELLPRPIYGVIFLFRWKEPDEQIDTRYKAGSKIWFANQTVSNACASYALLNIINNVVGLELGPQLDSFRAFTHDFTPALKGDAVANFDFVKKVHNSFARRMDKLNGDVCLLNQIQTSRQKAKRATAEEADEDSAHHFIAFMPIDNIIWKMDGLEWQARCLGKVKDGDWLPQIRSELESRMSRYENDQMDFAILGVVKDPLCGYIEELTVNIRLLQGFHKKLHDAGIRNVSESLFADAMLGPNSCYGITQDALDRVDEPELKDDVFKENLNEDLAATVQNLLRDQHRLKMAIREEMDLRQNDGVRATRRRHDCSGAISHWLRSLAQKQKLREVLTRS